jgi:hypothetical protein
LVLGQLAATGAILFFQRLRQSAAEAAAKMLLILPAMGLLAVLEEVVVRLAEAQPKAVLPQLGKAIKAVPVLIRPGITLLGAVVVLVVLAGMAPALLPAQRDLAFPNPFPVQM